jgi:hypothetical protein
MKTYNEHYEQCKILWSSKVTGADVLGLNFIENSFEINDSIFDAVVDQTSNALARDSLVSYRPFSKHLKDPRFIPAVKNLAKEITRQVEEQLFGSYFNIEFIHCYENLHKNIQESSSWLWHFDNCPDEYIKIAFHINQSTENNGCMKILLDKNSLPLRMKSDRYKPNDKYRRASRLSHKQVNSLKQDGCTEKCILGGRGSNFVFSPNILHKATIPAYNSEHRKMLMFYVRPSLSRNNDPFANTRIMQDGVDVKEYRLD